MSGNGGEKSEEEQILTCPGCMQLLYMPFSLSCMHVFCQECTGNLKRAEGDEGEVTVQCPICGCASNERDIEPCQLMNALAQEFAKIQRPLNGKRRLCDQCEMEDSHWKCTSCKIYLCAKCSEEHERIPFCRGHACVQGGLETDLIIDQVVFCDAHPERHIDYDCLECEVPVCDACRENEHEGHRVESVREALERLIPIHEKHCEELDGQMVLLQRDVDTINSRVGNENTPSEQLTELQRIKNHLLDLMTKYHTLRWWIALAIERSRGAFLLRELQGNIKHRLIENKRVDEQAKPAPRPKTAKATVKRPDDKKPKRPVRVPVVTRSSVKSFPETLSASRNLWVRDNVLELKGDGCARMGLVHGALWLPVPDMDHIKVLSAETGQVSEILPLPEKCRPCAVAQVNQHTIVLAALSGLYLIDHNATIQSQLREGCYCDVSSSESTRFICLESVAQEAQIFACENPDAHEQEWRRIACVQLKRHTPTEGESAGLQRIFNSVLLHNNTVLASSSTTNAQGALHMYQRPKKRWRHQQYDVDLRHPSLCGVDTNGCILMVDAWREQVLLINTSQLQEDDEIEARLVTLNHQRRITAPRDVLLVEDGTVLWLLSEGALGLACLHKYLRMPKEKDAGEEDDDESSVHVTDDLSDGSTFGDE